MNTQTQTLLLNYDYQPIRIISWKKAIKLLSGEKVDVVEEYEDVDIKTVSLSIKLPAVMRLRNYVKFFSKNQGAVKFNRLNVFHRDGFTCQYCDGQPGVTKLTYDHVIPKSRGGKTAWTNIVTCCHPCNSKKSNNTPKEMGWKLNREPVMPKPSEHFMMRLAFPQTPEAWKCYLDWNTVVK